MSFVFRSLAALCVVVSFTSVFAQNGGTEGKVQEGLLKSRLSQRALQEAIENAKAKEYVSLPGGVLRAPELYRQVQKVVHRLKATSMVESESVVQVFLASTSEVNAWVRQVHEISEVKVFHVVVTKGLLDLITMQGNAAESLGVEMGERTKANSEALLAAVLGHELGHAMNGDTSNQKQTVRMYFELAADEFGAKAIAEAGYDPQAMIELLEIFEKAFESKSLSGLLNTMLDEHPKPRFRIANVSDIVQVLRSGRTFEPEALVRTEEEKSSRSSVDGFKRKLIQTEYADKSLREKLNFLEQYLALSGNSVDGMSRATVGAIVDEYSALLAECGSFETINQLIESLGRFEGNVGALAAVGATQKKDSIKAKFSGLKGQITLKQVGMLEDDGKSFKISEIDQWAHHIDERYLWGRLFTSVKKAQSLDELKEIIFAVTDKQFNFQRRFRWHNSEPHLISHDLAGMLMENVAVRALDLTKDLEVTWNFIQDHFQVRGREGRNSGVKNIHYVFSALAERVLATKGVQLGGLLERLRHPKTQKDKVYLRLLKSNEDESWRHFLQRNVAVPDGDPRAKHFQYGVSSDFSVAERVSSEKLEFVFRVFPSSGVSGLFSDLVFHRYTLLDTVQLLEQEATSAATRSYWSNLKSGFQGKMQVRVKMDLPTQLDRVESLVQDSGPHAAKDEVRSLRESFREVNRREIRELVQTYLSVPFFYWDGKSKNFLEEPARPQPRPSHLATMAPSERIEILKGILQGREMRVAKTFGADFIQGMVVVDEALSELVSEGKLNDTAKQEFLETVKEISKILSTALETSQFDFEARYYELKRRARTMVKILEASSAPINPKLTESFKVSLHWILDLESVRPTGYGVGRKILNDYIVADAQRALRFLKGDVQSVDRDLKLVNEIVELFSFYEGFSDLKGQMRAHAQDLSAQLAKTIYHKEIVERGGRFGSLTFEHREAFKSKDSELLGLGEGFRQFIADDAKRRKSTDVPALVVSKIYFQDLWVYRLGQAATSTNAIESLVSTLGHMSESPRTEEEVTRTNYVLLKRALNQVQSKEEMELYSAIFALYLEGRNIGMNLGQELLSSDPKTFMSVLSMRYREHFYDSLTAKLKEYGAWEGQPRSLREWARNRVISILARVDSFLVRHQYPDRSNPLITKIWKVGRLFGLLAETEGYQRFMNSLRHRVGRVYTKLLIARGTSAGNIDTESFMQEMRNNTPWSDLLDEAIAERIQTEIKTRKKAVELLGSIRSLSLRTRVYQEILDEYGETKVGFIEKVKNYWSLYRAYKKAKDIWTEEVLEDLKKVNSLFEAWKITEKAWEEHVKKRAAEQGVSKDEAYSRLMELHQAKEKVESPYGAEVAAVFPEASRHRDEFLEKYAKRRPMNFEQLKMLEAFKSRKSESPYHNIAKAMFEFIDEYMYRLAPMERAHVALYIGGFEDQIAEELEQKISDLFYGTRNRTKMIRSKGVHFKLKDIKQFFSETHEEERLVAFRAMFVGTNGIAGDEEAERILIDRLLMGDSSMPDYLRRVLEIYLSLLNTTEKSTLLSWLLSNGDHGVLTGPQLVKLFVEKGGVALAKLAQIIASHGFKLGSEYREVLEVFKGHAQEVEKHIVMNWIKERLPKEKYDEIKTLDRELGSGSLKIAYGATLRDGRKVVIKLAREHVEHRTRREFEILRQGIQKIMADENLKIENLPDLEKEVERIISEEMKFTQEYELMKQHREAYENRPFLVRFFGNEAKVYFPQPLEGWLADGVLVEEFVEARGWDDLPERGFLGWTKEKFAKAAISEVLNQLVAYANPSELPGGQVIIDIDPHEKNQLAKASFLVFGKRLVDIDLGQSVRVSPDVIRGLHKLVFAIYRGKLDDAVSMARSFTIFRNLEDIHRYKTELEKQYTEAKQAGIDDPIEIFMKTMEEVELEGITLKPEFLYFQKLFATLVGLKRYVSNPNYMTSQIKKIMFLRTLSSPLKMMGEVREFLKPPPQGAAINCSGLFSAGI